MWDLKVCRGCLLTEAEAKLEPFNKTLKMGYQSLTGLEIKDGDGYPTYFCLECCVHIKKAWVFRRKSRRAFYAMKEIMIIRREISLKDIQTINRQKTHLMSPFSYWNIKNNVIYNIDKTEDEEGSMVAYTPVIDNLVFHTIEVIPEIDQNIEEKEIKPVEEIIDNVEVNENENGGDIDLEDVFKDFKEESSSESEIETAVLIEPIVANNAKKISYAYDVRIYKVCKALCNTNITVLSESEQKTIHEFKSKVQPFVAAKYRCAICQIKFDEIEQLMKHRQDHNDNHGEYSCNICQNRFISDEGLEIHTRECHLYQYSCITCSQIMFTVSEVIMHNEEQHPNVFKNEKIQMGSLRQHFDLVTLSPVEMYKRSNNVLLCFWCDKHFLDRNDWAEHVSDHKGAKRYFCDICLKSNNAISNLQRHMELFHMKQYKCKQCSELISSRKKLKRHIKNGHCVKKGSRKCNYCDVITVSEKKMLSHVWHKHFSEMYTYLCNICGRGYSSLNSLYRHQIVTHKYISPMDPKLGDPEHACSSCNVQFNTRRAYETHAVRANHPEAKDFPNVCVPCRKIFDTEEECRDHHLNVPKHYKYPRPCDIKFLKKHGIRHQTTVPRSSAQNGVAERAIRSVTEKARCMLQEAGLKKKFWAEAVNTAVYLKNRSPTKAVMGSTPEEKWTGKKENLSYLRIFGCQAYALQHKRDKLDPKSKKYIFVGYCDESKGYRLIDPVSPKNVIKARNVTFLEHVFWNDTSSDKNDSSNYTQISLFRNNVTVADNIPVQPALPDLPQEPAEISNENCQNDSAITIDDSESSSENPDDPADETYVPGDSTLEDYENSTDETSEFESASVARTVCSDTGDPQTVREALNGPEASKWKAAMAEEYKSFIDNKCWTLTDRDTKQRPVKCKWIFKRKLGLDGEILRYKARLVAKGYTQKYGIDYEETFSPVVRYSTIRTLLALATEHNMNIEHLDVKTAFLNGDLKETVFMEQPEGYKIKGQEDKVYKLNKAIYGLKQASKSWYEKINSILTSKMKFKRLSSEPCVYVKSSGKSMIIIALYVDDIMLFSSAGCRDTPGVKEELKKAFEIKDLGPAHHILGMRLSRQNKEITLDQSSYIKKVLERFHMSDCKPARTPMETGLKLVKSTKKDCTHDYRGLIGCLMYIAVCTRPDIAHAVSSLSQFNDAYDETHWKAAKRILRYLKGTPDNYLTFQKSGLNIVAYADADFASNEVDRRSYTGYVFKIGNSTISWESRKQKTVALSSTEAEYMCLSDACKEALFLRKFLFEIYGVQYRIMLFNDNQSALKLCTNSMYHARTKHIDVRHHFIREIVEEGTVVIKYLSTDEMVADVLTKPLAKEKHDKFVCRLFISLNK